MQNLRNYMVFMFLFSHLIEHIKVKITKIMLRIRHIILKETKLNFVLAFQPTIVLTGNVSYSLLESFPWLKDIIFCIQT